MNDTLFTDAIFAAERPRNLVAGVAANGELMAFCMFPHVFHATFPRDLQNPRPTRQRAENTDMAQTETIMHR